METHGNLWKSMEINGDQWKSIMCIVHNVSGAKSTTAESVSWSRRVSRSAELSSEHSELNSEPSNVFLSIQSRVMSFQILILKLQNLIRRLQGLLLELQNLVLNLIKNDNEHQGESSMESMNLNEIL